MRRKNANKKRAMYFLLFLAMISLAALSTVKPVFSQYYTAYEPDYTDTTSDSIYATNETLIPDWYVVSDEEIEFCQSYAGSETVQDYYDAIDVAYPVSKLTVSGQGQYTTLSSTRLYEIAWYVQPLEEDTSYTVYLIEEGGNTELLFTGDATAVDGDAGYDTRETDILYSDVQIVMEDGTVALTVPFVEKEG